MNWIKWCNCNRFILTTGQQRDKLPCELCQKEEHAKTLKDRITETQKEEEKK